MDAGLESGFFTLAEPARAVFGIVNLIIVRGKIGGDAGIDLFFLLRCSPLSSCYRLQIVVRDDDGFYARWSRATKELGLIYGAVFDNQRGFATWAVGSLVDENHSFAGSASQATAPVSCHADIATPGFNVLPSVVECRNVNAPFSSVQVDLCCEGGLLTYTKPAIAMVGVCFLIVVWREVGGDSGLDVRYGVRCCEGSWVEWRAG